MERRSPNTPEPLKRRRACSLHKRVKRDRITCSERLKTRQRLTERWQTLNLLRERRHARAPILNALQQLGPAVMRPHPNTLAAKARHSITAEPSM
jgi:hypothetical protein